MLDQLRQLAGCDRPWAQERAAFALQIIEQYQQGAISTEEYQELLLDLTRLDQVNIHAEDIEVKTMLVTAIYAAAQFV